MSDKLEDSINADAKNKEPIKQINESASGISSVIKDELALISFLVLFIGILSTDAYYATFGIKYQFLDIPVFHIVYRGLTILIDAPYLLLPYLIAIAWIIIDSRIASTTLKRRKLITYLSIFILIAVSFPLSRFAGQRQAERDFYLQTTQLPKIIKMNIKGSESIGITNGYYLLVESGGSLFFFKPLNKDSGETLKNTDPNIKRYAKSEIIELETGR